MTLEDKKGNIQKIIEENKSLKILKGKLTNGKKDILKLTAHKEEILQRVEGF